MIGIIGLNILFNLVFVFYESFINLKAMLQNNAWIKKHCCKYKNKIYEDKSKL